jgi:hypothetical protein
MHLQDRTLRFIGAHSKISAQNLPNDDLGPQALAIAARPVSSTKTSFQRWPGTTVEP